jgi:hypothetical protein
MVDGLQETYGRGLEVSTVADADQHQWTLCVAGTASGRKNNTVGFLLAPQVELVAFEAPAPRLTWVRVRVGSSGPVLTVINAHAPTEGSGDEPVEDYYHLLAATIRKLRPDPGSLVVMGNFNVNLGTGDRGPKPGDGMMGSMLREGEGSRHSQKLLTFCRQGGFVLPQTFGRPEEAMDSRSWATWRHPGTGQPHVKDLVLVPKGESGVVRKSRLDWRTDLLGSDHTPVVCRFLPPNHKLVEKTVASCQQVKPGGSRRKRGPKPKGPVGESLPVKLRRLVLDDPADQERYAALLAEQLGKAEPGWAGTEQAMS